MRPIALGRQSEWGRARSKEPQWHIGWNQHGTPRLETSQHRMKTKASLTLVAANGTLPLRDFTRSYRVVAGIINGVPLVLASWKTASALAAGCTMILKPAEETH